MSGRPADASIQLKGRDDGLSRAWEVRKAHASIFTGGKVAMSTAGDVIVGMCSDGVAVVDVATGDVRRRLGPDPLKVADDDDGGGHETITCFALNPRKYEAVTASRNLLLRHWDLETGECLRTWKVRGIHGDRETRCRDGGGRRVWGA